MSNTEQKCHNRVSKYLGNDCYQKIKNELSNASSSPVVRHSITDLTLKSNYDRRLNEDISEKYIVRFLDNDKNKAYLIKECTKGSRIKEVIEPINYETSVRILDRSVKWLTSSPSALVHELGVKMTTDRITPENMIRFDRDIFELDRRINITADTGIALSNCEKTEFTKKPNFESVSDNTCILQINYERIIPENIVAILGIKNYA